MNNKPCCVPGEMLCAKCFAEMEIQEDEPVTIRNPTLAPLDTSYVKVYGSRVSQLPIITCPPRAAK